MNQKDTLELARRGDKRAIEAVIDRFLSNRKVSTNVRRKDNTLFIFLEPSRLLDKALVVDQIDKALYEISIESIIAAKIYCRYKGEDSPRWIRAIELDQKPQEKLYTNETENLSSDSEAQKNIQVENALSKSNTVSGLGKALKKFLKLLLSITILSALAWWFFASGSASKTSTLIWDIFAVLSSIVFSFIVDFIKFIFALVLALFILWLVFFILKCMAGSVDSGSTSSSNKRMKWNTTSDKIWVESHQRKNGSRVKGHWRSKPK